MPTKAKKGSFVNSVFAGVANRDRLYVKLGWNGGKTLYEALMRYNEAVEKFRIDNNLSAAKVNELLKKPEGLKDSVLSNATTRQFIESVDAGLLGKVQLLDTTARVAAVSKKSVKKSK